MQSCHDSMQSICHRIDGTYGDKSFQGSQPLSLRAVNAAPDRGVVRDSKPWKVVCVLFHIAEQR